QTLPEFVHADPSHARTTRVARTRAFFPRAPESGLILVQAVAGGGASSQRGGPQPSRAICSPAGDWLTGITSRRLILRCGGRLATHHTVSAMSRPVIGCAPAYSLLEAAWS